MKSKIICACLCLVAVCLSTLLTVKLINSEGYIPPEDVPEQSDVIEPPTPAEPSASKEVELTENGISSFATKVKSFVETLAYGAEKDFGALEGVIGNLDRVSEFLATTEGGDKPGSEYYAVLSAGFKTALNGYTDDGDFSAKVSEFLVSAEKAAEKLDTDKSAHYPELDTSSGGSLTLAMLALYEDRKSSKDGTTFTVTVGGSIILGDKLSTPESSRFSSQAEKYSHTYPFFAISAVTASDDLTVAALEAPLTTSTASESTNPTKGSPEYASRLQGIDALTIASSGVMEYGEDGFNETVKALKDNGISYSVQESSQSLSTDFGKVVYITFDLTDTPVTDEQKERNKEVIRTAVTREREMGADLVMVLLHWNTRQRQSDSLSADYLGSTLSKYEPHFDAYNKEIARAAIGDGVTGADLVVGYGSRVAQGIESYNNKMIVYQTGDLSYRGSIDSEMKNTDQAFLFRQTFIKDATGIKPLSYRIIPIVNTTEEDHCLPQIVFDERADKIIEDLIYQSRYFGNPITNFNYIRITK